MPTSAELASGPVQVRRQRAVLEVEVSAFANSDRLAAFESGRDRL